MAKNAVTRVIAPGWVPTLNVHLVLLPVHPPSQPTVLAPVNTARRLMVRPNGKRIGPQVEFSPQGTSPAMWPPPPDASTVTPGSSAKVAETLRSLFIVTPQVVLRPPHEPPQ